MSAPDVTAELRGALQEAADWIAAELGDRLPVMALDRARSALALPIPPPASLPRLGIIIDGGLVQAVVSDQPEVLARSMGAILVVDYDTDGFDRGDLVEISGHDGLLAEAWQVALTQSQIDLDATLDAANALDARYGIQRPCTPDAEAHARQAAVLNAGG